MNPPLLIGICGGTASGKTELARRLVHTLKPVGADLLSLDNYYLGMDRCPAEIRGNFDHPLALDGPLLRRHLDCLRRGEAISLPVYDFNRHERTGWTRLEPRAVIIVEGMLLLALDKVPPLLDVSIFVDTSEATRLQRRVARDQRERGRSAESVLKQYHETVAPMHAAFVEPGRRQADGVVSGEAAPEWVLSACISALKSNGDLRLLSLLERCGLT